MSDYPWIEISPVTRASRVDLGQVNARCDLCGATSGDAHDKYIEEWSYDHAQECHPKWHVRKSLCGWCVGEPVVLQRPQWVVYDSHGAEFGCRTSFAEAIQYADQRARTFLRMELTA